MAEEDAPKSAKLPTQEEFDTIQNRIQLALSKREEIVKSWTAKSARKEPRKTDAELDAEDAALFRNEPPYLGVGALIPAQYLVSDAERNNKSLRAKLFPGKGLKGSKPRDEEEKAASAKRALNEESSDDEGGRSNLGKAKKLKTTKAIPVPAVEENKVTGEGNGNEIELESKDKKTQRVLKEGVVDTSTAGNTLATPPDTPEKTINTSENKAFELINQTGESGQTAHSTEVQVQEQKEEEQEQEESLSTPMKPRSQAKQNRLQKKKQRKKLKRMLLQDQKQKDLIMKLSEGISKWLDNEHAATETKPKMGAQDTLQNKSQIEA